MDKRSSTCCPDKLSRASISLLPSRESAQYSFFKSSNGARNKKTFKDHCTPKNVCLRLLTSEWHITCANFRTRGNVSQLKGLINFFELENFFFCTEQCAFLCWLFPCPVLACILLFARSFAAFLIWRR